MALPGSTSYQRRGIFSIALHKYSGVAARVAGPGKTGTDPASPKAILTFFGNILVHVLLMLLLLTGVSALRKDRELVEVEDLGEDHWISEDELFDADPEAETAS
jgi:hypothetical protein